MNINEEMFKKKKVKCCLFKRIADEIKVSGNEINVMYKMDKVMGTMGLYLFFTEINEKFNLVRYHPSYSTRWHGSAHTKLEGLRLQTR